MEENEMLPKRFFAAPFGPEFKSHYNWGTDWDFLTILSWTNAGQFLRLVPLFAVYPHPLNLQSSVRTHWTSFLTVPSCTCDLHKIQDGRASRSSEVGSCKYWPDYEPYCVPT